MEFTDTWLLDDAEALNLFCEVVVPSAGQSTADQYGIGGANPPGTEVKQSLHCMEVPESLQVDHQQGVRVKIPVELIIDDPVGYVQPQRVLWFQGESFQISERISPLQHTLKRVTLQRTNAM